MVDVKRDDLPIMLSRIQETDSYLACLCSVIGHRWCQIVVIKKKSTELAGHWGRP